MPRLTVNNQPIEYLMDGATPLLWALRDASNLTGAKYGCGDGSCGACTVEVDGLAVRACTMSLDEAEGRFVTTIESLSRDRSHPVQQAFVADQVPQCGFCTPGMVMAAAVLLRRSPSPSDAEIDAAITNLCRCGSYPRIRGAIRRASAIGAGLETISAAPPPRIDPADAARDVPALTPPTP